MLKSYFLVVLDNETGVLERKKSIWMGTIHVELLKYTQTHLINLNDNLL